MKDEIRALIGYRLPSNLRNKSDYRDFVVPEEARVHELLKESEVFIKAVETAVNRF